MTPVPTTTMIHSGVTTGCVNCHEANLTWVDMNQYPLSPNAVTGSSSTQYTGFDLRPTTAGGTYSLVDAAHPTTGDCSQCHSGFNYFSPQAQPSNHIPTLPGAPCATCHTTAGDYSQYTSNLTTLHSEVPTTCSTCHADGKGPFAGPSTFKIVQMSTRGVHIPITNAGLPVECSGCHKSVTTFTGTIMSHAAIGDTATAATGNACDACHEVGFRNKFYGVAIQWTRDSSTHHICGAPGTPTAPNVTICSGGGSDCLTGCHEHANQIPTQYKRVRPDVPRKQIAATPAPATPAVPATAAARSPASGRVPLAHGTLGDVDHTALGGVPCQRCHNGTAAAGKGAGHPPTAEACGDCHATLGWRPVLRIDHADVLARCASCHDGSRAKAKSASHVLTGNDCDGCHTTSAWKPAAFDHRAVIAGTCASCHDALHAAGKPARHAATVAACDSCHYVLGWTPLRPAAAPTTPTRKTAPPPVVVPRGRAIPVPQQ
jgi:hypothetical protein